MDCIFLQGDVNMKIFRILSGFIAAAIFLLIIAVILAYSFMESILFPSPHTGKKTGNMTLVSGNAELDVFYHRGSGMQPVILYSHGNNEYLAKIQPWLNEFKNRGYSILAYDYAGYGGSSGKAGEKQAKLDIETAFKFLTEKERFMPQEIIVIGYSVGSGPSSYLASGHKVRKLILIAPFASAVQVVLKKSLPFDRFKNAEELSRSTVPVTIFHGDKDRLIPFRNAETVYRNAAGPKKLIKVSGADHINIFKLFTNEFWKELEL